MGYKSEISGVLGGAGVNLEKQAAKAFGAAVGDFLGGGETLLPGGGISSATTDISNDQNFYASSYAMAYNTEYRPALKFLFSVEIVLKDPKASGALQFDPFRSVKSKSPNNEFMFMVQSIDRPQFDFEYQEVNMYNFRTKILKKITHQPVNLKFHDDVGQKVMMFLRAMLLTHIPVMRAKSGTGVNDLLSFAEVRKAYQRANGMTFGEGVTAGIGPLSTSSFTNTDTGGLIDFIRINQFMVNPVAGDLSKAVSMNSFTFINPKITSIGMNSLGHDESAPAEVNMSFDYDFLRLEPITQMNTPERNFSNIRAGTGAPGDISVPSSSFGSTSSPLTNLITGAASRVVQKVTSDQLNKVLKSIPGGQQVAGLVSKSLGNVGSNLAGQAVDMATTAGMNALRALGK
jgi:hypothetical protein